jgi:hypothetical protein
MNIAVGQWREDHTLGSDTDLSLQLRLFCRSYAALSPTHTIGSPPCALELVLPVALCSNALSSLSFRQAHLTRQPETPFSMEVDLSLFSVHHQFEAAPHLQTPANTPAVPNPAPISPMSFQPRWFNPSSNVTQASAVKPSFAASVPALLSPPSIIL